jgi:hypothetical protein
LIFQRRDGVAGRARRKAGDTCPRRATTTGKVNKLNSGKVRFAQTGLDVAVTFATNKTSPLGSVLVDLLRGQTFDGAKPTVQGELTNMFTPFPFSTVTDAMADPKSAGPIAAELGDFFGLAASTYAPTKKKAP